MIELSSELADRAIHEDALEASFGRPVDASAILSSSLLNSSCNRTIIDQISAYDSIQHGLNVQANHLQFLCKTLIDLRTVFVVV